MKFNLAVVNPPNYPFGHFLHDTIKLVCCGLESLGHDCTISMNNVERGRMNVLVAGHLFKTPADVAQLSSSGIDYVVLQSEGIRDRRLNLQGAPEHFENVYVPLMRGARGVWEGFSRHLELLKSLDIDARLLRAGYHPALHEVVEKRTRDIDFLFFGSVTPHRRAQLRALGERGFRIVMLYAEPHLYRNDAIGRTKVHLCPRQTADMAPLTYGRIAYLLNNRGLVVAETADDQDWLEACFVHAPSERWVDACVETLRGDGAKLAEEFHERYRALPMTGFLQPVVEAL